MSLNKLNTLFGNEAESQDFSGVCLSNLTHNKQTLSLEVKTEPDF